MDPVSTLEQAIASAPERIAAATSLEELERVENELLGKDSRGMANRQYREVQHHDMSRIPAGTMDFS